MEDLVQTLITGFLVSGLFIFIVWWFWRRYDQPSEAQLEREEELAKKKEEQAMWRAVEAQMAEEKAQMEEQALYLRKKAEQTQRAQPPAVGTLNNALEAFGTVAAVATTEASHASFEGSVEAPKEATHLDEADLDVEDDRDVLLASAPVDVRQDLGVVAAPAGEVSEPDWALVEKLDQLAKADAVEETPHPELPGAPDLGALATADLPDAPDLDSLGGAVTPPAPDHEDVIQWEHEQQENDPNEWDVEWSSIPDEEE